MYEEIDTSGQGKWNLYSIIGFVVVVSLFMLQSFSITLGEPPYQPEVLLAIIFAPVGACLIGGFFGAMKKRATRINPDRLEFTEDTRTLDDFGQVYYEGDFETDALGGHPAYACGLILIFVTSVFLGGGVLFGIESVGPTIALLIEGIIVVVLYIVGFRFAFKAVSLKSTLVKNPLYYRITKYVDKSDVLERLERCDIVSSIIVKYKVGEGQTLKAIDDIHVFAVTSTEPVMEIEITIEKMENIGSEFTYYLSEGLGTRKDEIIDVAGKDTHLIVDEIDMNSFIRVRYDMNRMRARWNLQVPESLCDLMHGLVDEVSKYMSVTKIPKIEDLGPEE